MNLTEAQSALVDAPLTSKTFLHGPAGSGKSTVGVTRLQHLLSHGVAGNSIIVLTPQRTLQDAYLLVARAPEIAAGSDPATITIGGLARRMCELFWPLVSNQAGFANSARAPFFLTLESSQYYMARIVRPLLDKGYFDSVTMDRNRLYSQILDSLNKSAAVGFPVQEIGSRLESAWVGDPGQRRIYADAQECATRFRQFCLLHSLLDFSLQLELFWSYLWLHPSVREYLDKTFRHLIYDNVEEDVPRAHDFVEAWLPDLDSALLIYDDQGGYRRFLGADVQTGWRLQDCCDTRVALHASFVMSSAVARFGIGLDAALQRPSSVRRAGSPNSTRTGGKQAVHVISRKFFPELLDSMVDQIHSTTSEGGIPPSEVVVIAPYLSDALRFALTSRLESRDIPVRTHRPSRSLRDEPATRALLTLAVLAHPHWNLRPSIFDVSRAFMFALRMDLIRAQLLAQIVFRHKDFNLTSFDEINPEKQERITIICGARYSRLRDWLLGYRGQPPEPLDYFLRRLFGEVLSQPGFGLHSDLDGARVAGSLVEAIRKFRQAMEPTLADVDHPDFDLGKEYMALLDDGVMAAQYLESWRAGKKEAVLLAPAHSFLMMNRPATIQFWLEPGSAGWFECLDQPLTHTRVLSRSWPVGKAWTFTEEELANLDDMTRLVSGLIRRCRQSIYICASNLSESGFEQRGRLLLALNQALHENTPAVQA